MLAGVLTFALVVAACGGSDGSSDSKLVVEVGVHDDTGGGNHDHGARSHDHRGTGGGNREDGDRDARDDRRGRHGKTLYAFANDQGTTSACTGGCATIWPPLMATGTPTGGTGIDAGKLSAAPSGQVVYNGHLLYTYANDSAAGDTNGQGVGGIWHVVAPSGDIIT